MAIASFDEPLHVILGGLGKNESYAELAADLRASRGQAYLIGAAAKLAAAIEQYELCGDLATVRAAAAAAEPGDVVLYPGVRQLRPVQDRATGTSPPPRRGAAVKGQFEGQPCC